MSSCLSLLERLDRLQPHRPPRGQGAATLPMPAPDRASRPLSARPGRSSTFSPRTSWTRRTGTIGSSRRSSRCCPFPTSPPSTCRLQGCIPLWTPSRPRCPSRRSPASASPSRRTSTATWTPSGTGSARACSASMRMRRCTRPSGTRTPSLSSGTCCDPWMTMDPAILGSSCERATSTSPSTPPSRTRCQLSAQGPPCQPGCISGRAHASVRRCPERLGLLG
mmetsp:Transcript_63482/g.204583  ORF Transcript_63482/g.204583 Transcript_63482/m.204583 type:complete len:222 (-) Transcript_63482:61-726(-)